MNYYLALLAVSLLCCACGFHMYIYFFSLGYGLSIAGIGVALLLLFAGSATTGTRVLCTLFILYGLRLSGYLLIREMKSSAYRKVLSPEMKRSQRMPLGAKYGLWAVCGLLYTLQTCPVFFRLHNALPDSVMLWIGCVIMVCGLALETVADLQKTAAKRKDAFRFVSGGLYSFVRCPNYLGEMIFWTGVLISGFGALHGGLQWACALVGFVLIVWIMFSGARRLEIRQDRNYGHDPEYVAYCKRVPILLPFVPLYSVKKYTFLVA